LALESLAFGHPPVALRARVSVSLFLGVSAVRARTWQ